MNQMAEMEKARANNKMQISLQLLPCNKLKNRKLGSINTKGGGVAVKTSYVHVPLTFLPLMLRLFKIQGYKLRKHF